ncbi:hypothetical protein M378DRAFT_154946 [Amanita muscaria Koide BX008]|uniref:Chromatin modification-related protein n=1 Tax=Amanita muscaria (strain Koide BX008) TaxID=946122 RepID=A0A0C2XP65_AMAMK|nr:hypothetical protein M378DRAFT_154946 [Amanita muscaria Koide BX008]
MAQPHSLVATSANFNPLNTPYSLSLLSEYTHSLDSLPLDLSRSFADLRELDAVLSSSMASIVDKIYVLIQMIERGLLEKEERIWFLAEIAEEAARLKLGGEDKIRVASQAADNLKSHSNHLRTLVELLPEFDASMLARRTTYPHVAPRSFMPVNSFESGRRRRPNAGSLLNASAPDPSPAKRKRVSRDDDFDVVSRSPRKDRTGEGGRSRNNTRRRAERAVSPSESLVSVTSHLPQAPSTSNNNPRGANNTNHPRSNGALGASATKQPRAGGSTNPSSRAKNHTPIPGDNTYHIQRDGISPPASLAGTNSSSNRRGASAAGSNSAGGASRNQYGGATPLSSGPGYAGQDLAHSHHHQGNGVLSNTHGAHAHVYGTGNGTHSQLGYGDALAPDWPNAHQLEGPGMPLPQRNGNGANAGNGTGAGAGPSGTRTSGGTTQPKKAKPLWVRPNDKKEDQGENELYCYCRNVSFGEMIACDGDTCELEWFHLLCTGLKDIPRGQWFCDECKQKKVAQRAARGGRRKNASARAAKTS